MLVTHFKQPNNLYIHAYSTVYVHMRVYKERTNRIIEYCKAFRGPLYFEISRKKAPIFEIEKNMTDLLLLP